jgi:hypothetical protein
MKQVLGGVIPWYAYEVKGSTSIHDIYLWDTAFQCHLITSSGLVLEDFSVIHLNNQYIRRGELNLHELFIVESVLKSIIPLQDQVAGKIIEMNQILRSEIVPYMDIGPQCSSPYICSFEDYCWRHIPPYSIFNVARLSLAKKFSLYQQGILDINDIPDDFPLSDSQLLQVNAEKYGEQIIDVLQIQKFLQQFKFPLYFLDFETFQPAVPMFDLSRPYQQITFQYSLHILDEENEHLLHKEFLAEVNRDPRISFIEKLIMDLGDKGEIVVYNKAFEITRLKEIARDFPEYKTHIHSIIDRVVDLMAPFARKQYYTPEMKGSYSIKSVLPALVQEISYENLGINKGDMASLAFESLYIESDITIIEKIRRDLLEYCKMDTLAMVEILKVLQKI